VGKHQELPDIFKGQGLKICMRSSTEATEGDERCGAVRESETENFSFVLIEFVI
jgi:hypothetical protein